MSMWLAFIGVGLGSYALRVGPLLSRRAATMPPRVDRTIQHAGTAALTALVMASIVRGDAVVPLPVVIIATLVGLAVAVRGGSLLRVLGVGIAVVLAARMIGVAATALDLTNAGWMP